MALMIPEYINPECKSNAEKKIYERFRTELTNSYFVFHSLGLSKHQHKIYSDIDFVIISLRGVIAIEVKGGRVVKARGRWYFTNRFGEMNSKFESPMHQSRTGMYALRESIRNRFGSSSSQFKTVFGYANFFTDISFNQDSPEWDLNRIYDIDKLNLPLTSIIKEIYDYSQKEITRISGKVNPPLNDNELEELIRYLRCDFSLIPSLHNQVENAYETMIRLSEEQFDVLEALKDNRRTIINGGAGTGKTVLAIEKARRCAKKDQKVLFLCFNKYMAEFLKERILTESLSELVTVTSLFSFLYEIIKQGGFENEIGSHKTDYLYRSVLPALSLKAISKLSLKAIFDVLIVDEGQDMKSFSFLPKILNQIIIGGMDSGMWNWFEDNQQSIFYSSTNQEQEFILEDYNPAIFTLNVNWRNTPQIATFTSMATQTTLLNCKCSEGPSVWKRIYKEKVEQIRIIEELIKFIADNYPNFDNLVILTAVSEENSILNSIEKIGKYSLKPYSPMIRNEPETILFTSIHKFKGLESKIIIVIDIEGCNSEYERFVNYVGMSRANSFLAVIMNEKCKKELDDLAYKFGLNLDQN